MIVAEDSFTIETFAKLTESKIEGIAAIPRFSRNNRVYPPEELAALDGKTVPILWAHQGTPMSPTDAIPADKIIGEATLKWDSNLQQLKYEGKVKEEVAGFVKTNQSQLGVSIGAHFTKQHLCTKAGCYAVATNLKIEEISLTPQAGMPETTVKAVESVTVDVVFKDIMEPKCTHEVVTPECPIMKAAESMDYTSRIKFLSAHGKL